MNRLCSGVCPQADHLSGLFFLSPFCPFHSWFLSLYINSMPLIFAFRVVDCVLAMGVKVLFQIGLAVLKINGEALLEVTDDGMFINLMRDYFATLGESAHPNHSDPRVRAITNFQELLVVAFREFNVITDETILSERKRFRAIISDEIESFSKRAAVRNLASSGRFTKDQIGVIYDKFFAAVTNPEANGPSAGSSSPVVKLSPPVTPGSAQDSAGRLETRIDLRTFRVFLSEVATWARDEIIVVNAFVERTVKRLAEHEVIDRLFYFWDTSGQGSLSLQDVVVGLDTACFGGLMESLEWFFQLHDKDKDGYLTKDEVIQLSESLLFIFRNEPGDAYLASISKFILNAFDFADAVGPDSAPERNLIEGIDDQLPATETRARAASLSGPNNTPYLNLATFRMVMLADELLETFFSHDLPASFRLDPEPGDYHVNNQKADGLVGGLMNMVLSGSNKSRLNKFADGLGNALGRHSEWRKPAIGKELTTTPEVSTRESLLNPNQQRDATRHRSPSMASTNTFQSQATVSSATSIPTLEQIKREENDMIRAAQEAVMHRPNFAIDAIGDSDPEDDDDGIDPAEDDGGVMDEVEAFLKANDVDEKGLEGDQKKLAEGEGRSSYTILHSIASVLFVCADPPNEPPRPFLFFAYVVAFTIDLLTAEPLH